MNEISGRSLVLPGRLAKTDDEGDEASGIKTRTRSKSVGAIPDKSDFNQVKNTIVQVHNDLGSPMKVEGLPETPSDQTEGLGEQQKKRSDDPVTTNNRITTEKLSVAKKQDPVAEDKPSVEKRNEVPILEYFKGGLTNLLGRLATRADLTEEQRADRSKKRSQKVNDLAKEIVKGFASAKQLPNSDNIQMALESDVAVKRKLKDLTSDQKLSGRYFDRDLRELQDEIVDAVLKGLKEGTESNDGKNYGFSTRKGALPTKSDLRRMLFGIPLSPKSASSTLFDITFQCSRYATPLSGKDKTTSPFGKDEAKVKEDVKAAMKTSGAMFSQEASKLSTKKSTFKSLDPDINTRTRKFFSCVRQYVEDCKQRQDKGESVDVRVLNELKGLLDKSFNPKKGGVGRFPSTAQDKDADRRMMGWGFVKFNVAGDLRSNGDALNVLEQELTFFENNLDDYLDRADKNPIVADALATQVHGTVGQIFNDILFNPAFSNTSNPKAFAETTKLLGILKDPKTGILHEKLDLGKLTDLQGRIRTNPLLMELDTENISGQLADKALGGVDVGKKRAVYKDILKTALMRSEHTKIDTVSGRRGRFKDIEKSYCAELSGRGDALNLVMNLPDGNLDGFAQELASELCLDPSTGKQLNEAITKDKVFGHNDRPVTAQRDRTLPQQLERIAKDPTYAARQMYKCLSREIGDINDELTLCREKKRDLEEAIDNIKGGKAPPKRFEDKFFLKKLFTSELLGKKGWEGIDWENPSSKDLAYLKANLGPLEDKLEHLESEMHEFEERREQTQELQQRFLMASVPTNLREICLHGQIKTLDEAIELRLQKLKQPEINSFAKAQIKGEIEDLQSLRRGLVRLGTKAIEEAPRLESHLQQSDFGSIRVEDQQGRVHKLRDLAEEDTVSSMIHEAHQRTLCSISGTTTDIGLALYAQYGTEKLAKWTGPLLDVANGKMNPADLPDEFRELFSSISIFMQGGQYHTPAEVLGGMLLVAATLEQPGKASDKETIEGQFKSLLKQLEEEPQNFLIASLEGRDHFTSKIDGVNQTLIERMEKPPTETSTVPKQEVPDLSGLKKVGKFAFEDDIAKGTVGLKPSNFKQKSESPENSVQRLKEHKKRQLEQIKDRDFVQELLVSRNQGRGTQMKLAMEKALTPEEQQYLSDSRWRTDMSIAKDMIDVGKGLFALPGDALSISLAHQFPDMGEWLKAHPDNSVGDYLKEFGHTDLFEMYHAFEVMSDVSDAIGLIKYSVGIAKANKKGKALDFELEKAERKLGQFLSLQDQVKLSEENKAKRKDQLGVIKQRMIDAEKKAGLRTDEGALVDESELQGKYNELENGIATLDKKIETLENEAYTKEKGDYQVWTRDRDHQVEGLKRERTSKREALETILNLNKDVIDARKLYESALDSYVTQEEAVTMMKEAYNKLAPHAKFLNEEIKTLRYKLSENSWKKYVRYPAGVISSGANLLSLLSVFQVLKPVASVLGKIGTFLGFFGIISAVASTVRCVKSLFKLHELSKEIKEKEAALADLQSKAREELKALNGKDPTQREIDVHITQDADASSLRMLLESTIDELKQERTDEKRDFWGEFFSAVSGYLSFALAIAGTLAAVSGVGLPFALLTFAGLGFGLVGSGILIGGAIAKRNRTAHRANKMADLQSGLNELNQGTPLETVKASHPYVAKLTKSKDPTVVKNLCRDYLNKRYINLHAERTYNNLSSELDTLRDFVNSRAESNPKLLELSLGGVVPPPSVSNPSIQTQYFDELAKAYTGDFAKDFPTLNTLRSLKSVGDRGIGELAWSGSGKEGMLCLLSMLQVKAVKTEDFTADSFNEKPTSQISLERGLEAATTSGVYTHFESGMAGVAVGLRKHVSFFAQQLPENDKSSGQSAFSKELQDFAARPSNTGSQARRLFSELTAFTGLKPDGMRNPGTVLQGVLDKANIGHRMSHVDIKSDRSWGEFVLRGDVSLSTIGQRRLRELDEPNLDGPFYLNVDRYDDSGKKQIGVPVDPMGVISSPDERTKLEPDLLICNRGDSRQRAVHVTYDRVGSQWFMNAGGRRLNVELDPAIVDEKRSLENPNVLERSLYNKIYRDLHENVVVVGYGVVQKAMDENQAKQGRELLQSLAKGSDFENIGKDTSRTAGLPSSLPFVDLRKRFSDTDMINDLEVAWKTAGNELRNAKEGSAEANVATGKLTAIYEFVKNHLAPESSLSPSRVVGESLLSPPEERSVLTAPRIPQRVTRPVSESKEVKELLESFEKLSKGLEDKERYVKLHLRLDRAIDAYGAAEVWNQLKGLESKDRENLILSDGFVENKINDLEKRYNKPIASPGIGLTNLANNCFMNSALAAFRSTNPGDVPGMPWLNKYLKGQINTEGEARALRQELVMKLPDLSPVIRSHFRDGSTGVQQDAAEVLLPLLALKNQKHEIFSTDTIKLGDDVVSTKSAETPLLQLPMLSGKKEETVVSLIGRLGIAEELPDYQVPNRSKEEIGEAVPVKTMKFDALPSTLAVNFQRFAVDEKTGTGVRLGTRVTDLFNPLEIDAGGKKAFQLKSVVCHIPPEGRPDNLYSGHYVTYEHVGGDTWREINDGAAREFKMSESPALKLAIENNCYVATYDQV